MIALLLLGTSITILQAQTVTTVTLGGNQYPVVDLTELTRLGGVLTKKECDVRRTTMYGIDPTTDKMISSSNSHSGMWNKKMSSKFQIMKNDYVSGSTKIFTWVNAWNGCKAYTGASDGGGSQAGQWRLPTQKELKMILILYPQLLEQGGMTAFDADVYWSATEYSGADAWYVAFNLGVVRSLSKTLSINVRCVRDL